MVYNKRKKNSRQRGSWTHGWGEKKKHRGAGSRGGRGNAGSGKRGDAKKPSYAHVQWGKHGFVNPTRKSVKAINVAQLDIMNLDGAKGVEKTKDGFQIDLGAMGYQKLLGAGRVRRHYQITALYASQSAIEKIESAGGKVTVKKEVGGKAHAADTAEKTESSS